MARRTKAKKKRGASPKVYSKGRIKRGSPPLVTLRKTTYRKALPELRRDFSDRCAYCMRHIGTETEMHVDHFDPRQKNNKVQIYSNLFLADAHCNSAKSNIWPTADEITQGCRFLNCCDEEDYGKVIFEDPTTHELIGTSPAAIYHIEMIDLNDPGLIDDRRFRADLIAKLEYVKEKAKNNLEIMQAVNKLSAMAQETIPDIPAPPGYWTMLDRPVSV